MNHVFCTLIKIDELDAIKITHPVFNATLLLQGAQLIEFSPKNNQFENMLWLSPSAQYKHGKPIRGGIPICWPWFGNLDKNPVVIQDQVKQQASASAHGFARLLPWEIKSIHEDCHHIDVSLILTSDSATKELWPFDFDLEVNFTFSTKLKVKLTTINTGTHSFSISQALHTYLPTEDIDRSYIHNTQNLTYIDALENWNIKQQIGNINFNSETDRLYFFEDPNYSLRLETPNQTLLIKNFNSQSAVIWNPWIEKSKRLSQYSPQDFRYMLCIETANVVTDVKNIDVGKQTDICVEFILNP